MSIVLKPGMNLPAFAKELEALVEKHGGILRTTPSITGVVRPEGCERTQS